MVLDEVHGAFGSKRGIHWMSAVEWLLRLFGEFQRVSLSATIRRIPKRVLSNHAVFRGTELIARFSLSGTEIQIEVTPEP